MKETVFSGKCTIEAEVGAMLSTEDQKVIGTNSNAFVRTEVRGAFGKTRGGGPRFEPSIANVVSVYPQPGDVTNSQVGDVPKVQFLSNHRISKNGALISPFLSLEVPIGRQVFEEFNDHDAIMRFGFRLTFGH